MEQNLKNLIAKIPKEVSYVTDTLEKAGFEAYLVGGCVRDLLMEKTPKDWDVTRPVGSPIQSGSEKSQSAFY